MGVEFLLGRGLDGGSDDALRRWAASAVDLETAVANL